MRVRILAGVRFLRRSENAESASDTTTVDEETDGRTTRGHTTPGKGRATPKRRDAEAGGRRRGPAPTPPRTQREASKLARQNRPSKEMSSANKAGGIRIAQPAGKGVAV